MTRPAIFQAEQEGALIPAFFHGEKEFSLPFGEKDAKRQVKARGAGIGRRVGWLRYCGISLEVLSQGAGQNCKGLP